MSCAGMSSALIANVGAPMPPHSSAYLRPPGNDRRLDTMSCQVASVVQWPALAISNPFMQPTDYRIYRNLWFLIVLGPNVNIINDKYRINMWFGGCLHAACMQSINIIRVESQWHTHGRHIADTWQAHWQTHGRHMADTWQTDTWQTHGQHLTDTWNTHGIHMEYTWPADTWQTHG